MRRFIVRASLVVTIVSLLLAIAATTFVYIQAQRTPAGPPIYVALGSSFAAGPALGPRQERSPLLCARTINSYPQRLARMLRLPIVDMTCGGATTAHLLHGGQFFQGPQLRTIDRRTRLVTITIGGNDIGYVGDLSLLAARNAGTMFGGLVARFWGGPPPPEKRDVARLQAELLALIDVVKRRAPNAQVVVATYPAILPPHGTCARLGLREAEADLMRGVAAALTAATRRAVERGDAIFVDMNALGAAHHACAAVPWTKGWAALSDAPFHPTTRGAEATATAIAAALRASPAAIAPVGQYDAAGHQARRIGR